LSEVIWVHDARCLTFLVRMLEVSPIVTFTADDVLLGLRLAAILETASNTEAAVPGLQALPLRP
jgi:hypothetical protein